MGTAIIIGMASLTVVSSIAEGVLSSVGKMPEAQYMQIASKSLLIVTCVTLFAKALKALATLG